MKMETKKMNVATLTLPGYEESFKTKWSNEFYLWGLQRDLHTHGSADARKLAGQRLLGLMGNFWDVFDGQIKLKKKVKEKKSFTSEDQ